MKIQTRYCELKRQEQRKQNELLKRINDLEAQISSKNEEEEVKIEFKDRDKLRMSMMNLNEFEEDFEEYEDMSEEDQLAKIQKLQKELDKRVIELEDTEKENLDSRMVMLSEYKEQLKMIDFFRQLILTQISKGELEQLRIQAKWSDKDNDFQVPVFYAKNGKVNPLKLPKHEILIKLSDLYESRALKIETDRLVQKVDLDISFDDFSEHSLNDNLNKNQRIDKSFYKSKSHLVESTVQRERHETPFSKLKQPIKPKQHRLPPVNPDN